MFNSKAANHFLDFWPLKMEFICCREMSVRITTVRCPLSQERAVLVFIVAEFWNHVFTEELQLSPAAVISAIFVWGCGINTRWRSAEWSATDGLQLAVRVFRFSETFGRGWNLDSADQYLMSSKFALPSDRPDCSNMWATHAVQCDVTSNVFVQPSLKWKSNKYYMWVCVCSLRYPACSAHAAYCNLWPARMYNIFPHLINGNIFGGGILNMKCVFWCSLQLFFFWNSSHSKKNWARYDWKCVLVFM